MSDFNHPTPKGYWYCLTDEAILKYMQWPIKTRLVWLEEANRFLFQALTEETKRIREQFRKAEI